MHIIKKYIKKIVKSHQNIKSQKFIKIKIGIYRKVSFGKIRNALNQFLYKN